MLRPMILAMNGWYPANKDECSKEIEKMINPDMFIEGRNPISAVVPHAGWYFCGELSVNCIRVLKEKNGEIKNVFIFGGHLTELNLAILETFDYAQTPFGKLKNNNDILNELKNNQMIQTVDYLNDNTIEILLPIVNYFFGDKVTITAIYLPPNLKIKDLISDIYKKYGKNSVFIGSTDLTHYGPNYSFYHTDNSLSGIDWVTKVNDKNYINLLLEMKEEEALKYALQNKSACSAGAALGALLIGKMNGVKSGKLLGYNSSYEKHKSSSFVGYTGILY